MAGPVPPGWTECLLQPYGTSGPSVAVATAFCTGDLMMLAGGVNGSSILTVLAWAPKADVLFVTGTNAVHQRQRNGLVLERLVNGICARRLRNLPDQLRYQFGAGFGSVGDSGDDRLCWRRNGSDLNGGWRAGNTAFLNSEPSGYPGTSSMPTRPRPRPMRRWVRSTSLISEARCRNR